MNEVTWQELLVRICAGEASETPCEGVLEVRADDEDGTRTAYRVQKDRDRWRVSSLDGDPVYLQADGRSLRFDGDEASVLHGDGLLAHEVRGALERREPWDWQGKDFTTPTGPPRATTYLGRDA